MNSISLFIYYSVDDTIWYLFKRLFPINSNFETYKLTTFSETSVEQINLQLAKCGSLMLYYDNILKSIIDHMKVSKSSIKANAIKSLSKVVDQDPTILQIQEVIKFVEQQFNDNVTSVRESAVDLIGKSVKKDINLMNSYRDDLTHLINDNGVSVRSTVIKIFGDFCIACCNCNYPYYHEICNLLLSRVNDESDRIKKLVASTFECMWFSSDCDIIVNRIGSERKDF